MSEMYMTSIHVHFVNKLHTVVSEIGFSVKVQCKTELHISKNIRPGGIWAGRKER